MISLFISEDEVKSFSFPLEGPGKDQTSLVKAGSLEEFHPFFLIVSSLPHLEEEEDDMVRSPRL